MANFIEIWRVLFCFVYSVSKLKRNGEGIVRQTEGKKKGERVVCDWSFEDEQEN